MKRVCSVYRCAKQEGMYIYVDKQEGFARIPAVLLQQIGATQLAMTLVITPDKSLARADAGEILRHIADQGFYLQMPPSPNSLSGNRQMQEISGKNSQLLSPQK